MNEIKRVFLIVLDSCGIGNAPDAKDFGDNGANTIKSISKSKEFNIKYDLTVPSIESVTGNIQDWTTENVYYIFQSLRKP